MSNMWLSNSSRSAPKYLKKVRLDIGKEFKDYYNLKDRPSTIKITGLDIPTNAKFKVCLNNILVDDGECSKGFNSKGNND